jgi:hypothetical protein
MGPTGPTGPSHGDRKTSSHRKDRHGGGDKTTSSHREDRRGDKKTSSTVHPEGSSKAAELKAPALGALSPGTEKDKGDSGARMHHRRRARSKGNKARTRRSHSRQRKDRHGMTHPSHRKNRHGD